MFTMCPATITSFEPLKYFTNLAQDEFYKKGNTHISPSSYIAYDSLSKVIMHAK